MEPRPFEELPGSGENYQALLRLLVGWKCCGAPSLCGATCVSDELSAVLARAHTLITQKLLSDVRRSPGDGSG